MMGKKRSPDDDPFGDLVVEAFMYTTNAQRKKVLDDWENGKAYHRDVAYLLRLDSEALLLAALLEHAHPSVCGPGGPKAKRYDKLREIMLKTVDNPAKTVDNPLFPVDNSVDDSVDENGILLQKGEVIHIFTDVVGDLSTYPHFIHNWHVDKNPCF